MRSGAKLAAAVVVTALSGAAPSPAVAESDLPRGRIGLALGVRQGTGVLGNSFGVGPVLGVEAGYVFDLPWFEKFSIGGVWSVLWGRLFRDDPTVAAGDLDLREMNFGLHFRRVLGDTAPRFLAWNVGLTLLRSNVPIPPDSERGYVGPYASIGVEQYVRGTSRIGVEVRYGIFAGGPTSLTILTSFSFGSR